MERVRIKPAGGNYFAEAKSDIEFIRSGSKTFDLALGGGWAEGRIANIIGDKSTGKTLLCIEAAANFAVKYNKGNLRKQKIRYREAESAFSNAYAGAIGMPLERVDFGEPLDTVEDFFEDLSAVARGAKGPELYILDSLDSLSDRAEMKREMDKGTYGAAKAQKMSQLFRRLVRTLERKKITLIIVSQVRDKIGVMFGRKWSRTGGRALDFYSSQTVVLANLGRLSRKIRGQTRATGVKVKAMLDKNKVSLPFREAEFKIKFGYGIDDADSCVNFLGQVKGLKELRIRDPEQYIKDLAQMDQEEFDHDMAELHEAVARHWYAIEKTLMPTRRKYGA